MKVSVIIPIYNARQYIINCLNSVAAQTMTTDVECLLVDDCSTDGGIQLAEQFIENNKSDIFFQICCLEYNQGPSAARNRGIREAQGEYLFFLDSDDTISPDCIENLYALAKRYDADYVQGTYSGETRRKALPQFSDDRKWIKQTLLNHNVISFTPHNRLVKRQIILDHNLFFNEKIRVREDFLWMTFVAKYVTRFASSDKVTYIRRYNKDSLTNNINREREILGYRVLIEQMVANYDPFLLGCQKELALEALLMTLRAEYYHDDEERRFLIDCIKRRCNFMENTLLGIFLRTNSPKVLHALIRLYKIKDL